MQARTRKNHPKTRVESSDEGEAFNFNTVSDTSAVDNEPVAKAVPAQAKRTGRAVRAIPTVPSSTATAAPDPLNAGSSMAHDASEKAATDALLQPFLPTTESNCSNRALDTKYFFPHGEVMGEGEKVTKQICHVCQ
jgi:hypothetical protein